MAYYAYGKVDVLLQAAAAGEVESVREKFTGKEHDVDGADEGLGVSGMRLDYFGFRYYDAVVGVWTSADPAHEFYHAYSYVGGSPVATVDPLGLAAVSFGHSYSGDDLSYYDPGTGLGYVYFGDYSATGTEAPDVSPLDPGFGPGGPDIGFGAGDAPGVDDRGGSGIDPLPKKDYDEMAMSGEGGGANDGVTSEDIARNKARAEERASRSGGGGGGEGAMPALYEALARHGAPAALGGTQAAYKLAEAGVVSSALRVGMNPHLSAGAARASQLSHLSVLKGVKASGRFFGKASLWFSVSLIAIESGAHVVAGENVHAIYKAGVGLVALGVLAYYLPAIATVKGAVLVVGGVAVATEAAMYAGDKIMDELGVK